MPWPMRRPLKHIDAGILPLLVGAGSALADEEAIETSKLSNRSFLEPKPAVPWPMRRPLKPADISGIEIIFGDRQCLGR